MLHSSEQEVLAWLSTEAQGRDLVVFHAMNNHQCRPYVYWDDIKKVIVVVVTTRTGVKIPVGVRLHPVTREPIHFGRLPNAEEEDAAEVITL